MSPTKRDKDIRRIPGYYKQKKMFSASELPATAEKEKTSNGSSMYNGFVMPG